VPLTEDPYIYHICFEVEQVVEKGGPIVNGNVVHLDEATMGSMNSDGFVSRNGKRVKNGDQVKLGSSPSKWLCVRNSARQN
jgi:hypothetical protein